MIIAIIDSHLSDRQQLSSLLKKTLLIKNISDVRIDFFSSGEAFVDSFRPGKYSLIFLDIFPGPLSGIDIAKIIKDHDVAASVIFMSASNSFASQSYEVGASYYLHKPIREEDVLFMLNRLDLVRANDNRFIELPDGHRIFLSDLVYTERFKHYATFHTTGEQKKIRMTQKKIEELLLMHPEFIATNQGNLINLSHAKTLTADCFHMSNGHVVPISKRRYKLVEQAFTKHCFEKALR